MKYNKLFICRFECVINAKEKQIHMVKKHKFDVFINIKMEHNKKRNNNKKQKKIPRDRGKAATTNTQIYNSIQ